MLSFDLSNFLYFLVRELFACPITWLERLLFFFRKLCHENFEFPCLIISFILVALTFSLKHIVVCTFTLQEHCFVWINIADVYQKARCLPKSKRTFTLHVYCLFNSMHLKPTVLEWNRNWARIDRLWRAFLIPRNYFLLWQGITCYGKWVTLTIGLKSTMQFFMKRQNYKGTISFGAGFFLVVIGWPIIGMILEAYGFIVLFSGFWPTLAVFLQRIPILGWIFQQPFIRSFFDRYRGKRVPV